jgi:hypothetical protein
MELQKQKQNCYQCWTKGAENTLSQVAPQSIHFPNLKLANIALIACIDQ